MKLMSAVPALPVLDVAAAAAFYRDRLGFPARHAEDGFAIVRRDDVEIHLWAANRPDIPGAEPHLAGSASCRIRVQGIDDLYAEYRAGGVIHPNGALASQPWGDRDFSVLDQDGNCLSFAESSPSPPA